MAKTVKNFLADSLTTENARKFFGVDESVLETDRLNYLLFACERKAELDGFDVETPDGRLAVLLQLGFALESEGITARLASKTFTDFSVSFLHDSSEGVAAGYAAKYKQHKIDVLGIKHRIG